jgi:uncharacterized protein (TIGR02145 family)
MKQKILSLIAILGVCATTYAQCPNFTDLSSPSVTAYTGRTYNPFAVQGIVPGRHTLITQQGTDPRTGGALSLLPAGESQVIKLGNEYVGAEAEALCYRFMVDVDNALLLLKFAVVLEDPNHPQVLQPRFVVRVTDAAGNLTEECAEYDVSAGAGIPGFQTYQIDLNRTVRWRNWTNVGLDLAKYVGQEVQVQFITYDCSAGAHFGYAYFTASCMPNRLQLEECLSGSFTLAAPADFESYLWSNGSTERTATFNTGEVNNSEIICTVTSATGCQFNLYAYIATNQGSVEAGDFTDIICEGETYTQHGFNLPPQPAGQHFYQMVIVNPAVCTDNQFVNLYLTVIKRYNLIKAAICHGNDYTENGFNIINPLPGVRRDTIYTGTYSGCDAYNVLELTVSVNFSMPNIIEGETSPCTDELFIYSFSGSGVLSNFQWIFPDNVVVVSGKYMPQVTVYFTDDMPCEIILHGANGCGSGSASLSVNPRKTQVIQLNEQICEGEEFNSHNFNLGVQNDAGYFVYSKHLQASSGCDSIVTLALNVLPKPVMHIEPAAPALCNAGEEITLWALADTVQYPPIEECDGDYPIIYIYDCGLDYLWNTGDTEGFITINPNETTNYTVTVTLNNGCSASASKSVVVDGNEPVIIHETICRGEMYSAYNITATETGIYETTIETGDCIIPVALHLTVIHPSEFHISRTICAGERFTEYGFDFTLYQEGLFRDTVFFISSTGCDSLVTFALLVLPEKTTIVYDAVCQYSSYTGNGFTLQEQYFSGLQTYTRVVPSVQNCDSTVILKLLVNPVQVNMISDEDMMGNHYQKYGFDIMLTTSGLVSDTLYTQTKSGCDSTVILNLNVIPLTTTSCSGITLYATGVSPDGFIMLEWEWNPPPPTETYGYMLFQWDSMVGWQSISTHCDKTIQVLNVYPDNEESNTLASWMHDPDIGLGKILVTSVAITNFNNNPNNYLKNESGAYQYDVIMFGSWDSNNGRDLTPISAIAVRDFLNSGRGVLFGHDTQHYGHNFSLLKDKVNLHIAVNHSDFFRGSEIIKVINDGFLLKYPHHISYNETLTIPCTHTSGQFAKGIVWMNFPDPQQGPCFHAPIQELEGGTNDFYLTTWNNAAMIQTGHTSGQSTPDERKVIANTLWYLSQFTTDTTSIVCSAFDLAAPNIPTVIRQTCNQIEITSEDNGTPYRFYVKAINMVNNSDTCTSNILDVMNKTGLRGFYILEDEYPTCDSDLSYLPLTSAMYNQPVIYDANDVTKYIHVQAVDSVGNLSAVFTLDPPTYDIILSANPTVGGTACCNSTYSCNDTVKIEAFPYPCYRFEKWTINDTVLYDNPYEFVITENMHFVAHFSALNPDTLCCPATISDNEGHVYKVTKLAGLCWTSNLRATVYDDGTPIASAKPYYSAFYPDTAAHIEIFGLLYTWYSAVGLLESSTQTLSGFVQGICPKGWHIPLQEEWNRLSMFPAEELKSIDYWFIPGTDRYGFDSRPAGWYNGATNRFEELYGFTGYWSILSDNNIQTAHYFLFTYYCDGITDEVKYKRDGLSVRCVMNGQ